MIDVAIPSRHESIEQNIRTWKRNNAAEVGTINYNMNNNVFFIRQFSERFRSVKLLADKPSNFQKYASRINELRSLETSEANTVPRSILNNMPNNITFNDSTSTTRDESTFVN